MLDKIKSMADNEKFKAAGAKIKNIFQFGRNCVKMLINIFTAFLIPGGKALYEMGISANTVTVAGFIIGLLAINFLAMNMFWLCFAVYPYQPCLRCA